MKQSLFTSNLRHALEDQRATFEQLAQVPIAQLERRPANGGWSAIECLAHLNRYDGYYRPRLEKAMVPGKGKAFRSGWLGKKIIAMMDPDTSKGSKKQKTLKRYEASNWQLDSSEVLNTFRAHLNRLEGLLESAATADLNAAKVPIEFFPLLKMRVGDAFLLVMRHDKRHLQQALRAAGLSQLNPQQPLSRRTG